MSSDSRPSVCVFCSSSIAVDDRYLELADQVGVALGGAGMNLVSGAGSISMMGRLATAARSAGCYTTGVIPEALMEWDVVDRQADDLVVTPDMRTRKAAMDEHSDAFLALPGGLGTLEELVEVWVARSLGMHHKPIVVLDPWGDFGGLHGFLDHLVDAQFMRNSIIELVSWQSGVDAAIQALQAGLSADVESDQRPAGHPDEWLESN